MEKAVYINSISAYLPNSPIANEDMEDYIGKIGGNPSRVRSIVLRQNGIKTRYYGLDKNKKITHSNAQLAKEAVCGLFENRCVSNDLTLLTCGTSTPDQLLPSHASMVHGELACYPMEIFSSAGVCFTSLQALKICYSNILAGLHQKAVCVASELRFLFTSILSILLVSVSHAQTNVIDGHEYIDMGLPSGTLWATCNIGAESSIDFGDYFAWGETEPKEEYTNENYKFFEGYKEIPGVAYYMLCTNIGENICGTEYDAARVKWGGRWRLPTYEEIGELVRLCWNKWEEVDGIWGIRFHHGANENTLFLPAAGYADTNQGKTYHFQNWKGVYWTGILEKVEGAPDDHISSAMDISFGSGGPSRSSSIRTLGYPIRPVINLKETGIDDITYRRDIRMAYRDGSIELSSIENCDHIYILNICGQSVFSSPVSAKNIDVPKFSKGVYICTLIKQGKSVHTQKIIIK